MPTAQFLGHSCVLLTEGPHRLVIDPFLTHNPKAVITADKLDVTHILVSHGHDDHLGDTVAIAKRTGATVIANFELSNFLNKQGVSRTHAMHIGGSHEFEFGRVKLTIAHHGGSHSDDNIYTGPPAGFLIELGGKTIYHAGDTGLFYDMKLIGEMNRIDLAFLPIGDNYTMGIDDAVKATEFLRSKVTIPIHYDTFPLIEAPVEDFVGKVKDSKVVVLKPGESFQF